MRQSRSRALSARLFRVAVACFLLSLLGAMASGGPSGFGRFGRFHDDGLLTLNVTPQGFETPPTAGRLRGEFGEGAVTARVVKIGPTGKSLALTGGGPGAPLAMHSTLLYPGFSATFGNQLRIRFEAGPSDGRVIVDAEAVRDRAGNFGILVWTPKAKRPPLLIAFRPGFAPRPWAWIRGANAALLITSTTAIGEVRFITPLGIRSADPGPGMRARAAAWAEEWLSTPIPVPAGSHAELTGPRVRLTETYASPAKGRGIAPVPPALAFAAATGYPARIDGRVIRSACITKWGPFAYVEGPVMRATLPIPPTASYGWVRSADTGPATAKTSALINELVGHLGGDWVRNAVDLGYAGMANAQLAWCWLTPERRAEVIAAWKRYLPDALRLPPYPPAARLKPWMEETEPLSGRKYFWTYFIDGPGGLRYDLDWGCALPLYGLQQFAQYHGAWSLVRANWPAVLRISDYFEAGYDWAWMTAVNADHGYSTGTGDPLAASLCAAVACLRMARAVGDRAAEARFAAWAARTSVAACARFAYTPWARREGLIGPKSVVLGYHELEGFTRSGLGTDDPWDATSVLSADGALPETFAAFAAFARSGFTTYLREYAAAWPDWFRGDHVYSSPTTYAGNSVYVVFPHVMARSMLGEPAAGCLRAAEGAVGNRNNAWVGPPVLAELLGRAAPLRITEWQPAALRDAHTSTDGRRVAMEFTLRATTDWTLEMEAAPRVRLVRAWVAGKPAVITQTGSRCTIRTRASGDVRVIVERGEPAPPAARASSPVR